MPFILILSTLAVVAGVYIAWLVHSRLSLDIAVDPQAGVGLPASAVNLPQISVIIPARNEAGNIRQCVQSILAQDYPNYELIVVDDRSTDDTLAILNELHRLTARLHIIHGTQLPPGWAGKPHALVQGARAACGEWLCFMDADTFAAPTLLSSTYQTALRHRADMFSILTRQVLGSFWERVILPLVFLGLSFGFPARRVNDPARPDAIANGQFILFRRTVYEAMGGHAAVKQHIDEDKAIAALAKRAGFRLILADGRQVASTRMYTSLPGMWEGWTKNIYPGLSDRLWLLLFGVLLGLTVAILLPVWLFGSLIWLLTGGGLIAALVFIEAAVLWAYLIWWRWQAARAFDIPAWYAITFPLGAALFTAMMLTSAYNILSGRGVQWKGRRYY